MKQYDTEDDEGPVAEFRDRVIRKLHERYDAMCEALRRRAQDALDEQSQKDSRQ